MLTPVLFASVEAVISCGDLEKDEWFLTEALFFAFFLVIEALKLLVLSTSTHFNPGILGTGWP